MPQLPENQHYLIVGGGISGLCAAYELASRGAGPITVVEAGQHWGGCVSGQEICGLTADAGAESFATRSPVIAELLQRLGLGEQIIAPHQQGAYLYLPEGAFRLPRTGVLGIPGDLDQAESEVQELLSPEGLARAREDVATTVTDWGQRFASGQAVSVAELVRDRMGEEVLQRLVAPVVTGVHSAEPENLDLATAAPGLAEALVREGSLTAAVRALRGGTAVRRAGSAVAGIRGGMNQLTQALVRALEDAGVRLVLGVSVQALNMVEPDGGAGYQVHTSAGTVHAQEVVVATAGPEATSLLSGIDPRLADYAPPAGHGVALVSVVVDHPGLDAAPRGSGILVSPMAQTQPGSAVAAKAMTHASIKWEWIRQTLQQENPHRHLLRLSYGRITQAEQPLGYHSSDDELIAAAMADIPRLTGCPLNSKDVVETAVVRWLGALPMATLGHKERVAAVRNILTEYPGLHAVGAWLAGTGLVAVVADVQKTLSSAR